jgi:hypothetical protein
VSSDLSDCEDVWIGELSDYIIETHKRQRQVESWFEASVLVSILQHVRGEFSSHKFFRNAILRLLLHCRDITWRGSHEYLLLLLRRPQCLPRP